MSTRITYNSINIDGLTLTVEGPKPNFYHVKHDNRSGSGAFERINEYGLVNISFTAFFSQSTYHDLIAFYSWARLGRTFSFAVDSSNVANTTLDSSAASAQKVVPLTATTGIASGDNLFLRAADGIEYEVIEVDSVSVGVSVTAVSNLKYSYVSGDTCRHLDYYPSLISKKVAFNPQRTGNVNTSSSFYYRDVFEFEESPT